MTRSETLVTEAPAPPALPLERQTTSQAERRRVAVLTVGIGLLVGVGGTILFYDRLVGLSAFIFMLLCSGALFVVTRAAHIRLNERNAWVLVPLLGFALMLAFRDDPLIGFLNGMSVLALAGLTVHYLTATRPLDIESFAAQTGHVVAAGIMVLPMGVIQTGDAWGWLRDNRKQSGRTVTSVVRGLAFAAPVVLIFGVLLSSADQVFARAMNDAWAALGLNISEDAFGRLAMTGFLTLLSAGALAYSVTHHQQPEAVPLVKSPPTTEELTEGEVADLPAPPPSKAAIEKQKPPFSISIIESSIVLGSVVALFAAFVVIQFRYFFGGQSNIAAEGFTYAAYARRGFFELAAVSTLTLGLALILDRVTIRQGRENLLFRGLTVAMVALTSVMLVSAWQRMQLYEEAYGFTQLRVYTQMSMVWLGVLFAFFLLALFRLRLQVFSLGMLVVIIGYLASLNLLNVDRFIADRNIDRYQAGAAAELDIAFLNTLSADAVPSILPFYRTTQADSIENVWAGQWLRRMLDRLDGERSGKGGSLWSWNASREEAWRLLDSARAELPAYDPSLYWSSLYPEDEFFNPEATRP
ncbi:MAG TPA: DUF4173 domain-containing protein [Aggregatilineales bacterium]|nr:DUF4173 domain-containing protein [Aggregatilineales bacterium]